MTASDPGEPWVVADLVFAVTNHLLGLPTPLVADALDELEHALRQLRGDLTGLPRSQGRSPSHHGAADLADSGEPYVST